MIYNVCEHAKCYKETGAQAVSYTTGVPPVVGAMMLFQGHWQRQGRVQRRAAAVEAVHGRDRQAGPAVAPDRREEGATRKSCSRSRLEVGICPAR